MDLSGPCFQWGTKCGFRSPIYTLGSVQWQSQNHHRLFLSPSLDTNNSQVTKARFSQRCFSYFFNFSKLNTYTYLQLKKQVKLYQKWAAHNVVWTPPDVRMMVAAQKRWRQCDHVTPPLPWDVGHVVEARTLHHSEQTWSFHFSKKRFYKHQSGKPKAFFESFPQPLKKKEKDFLALLLFF